MNCPLSGTIRKEPLRIRRRVRLKILAVLAPSALPVIVLVGYALMQLNGVSQVFGGVINRDLNRLQAHATTHASGMKSGQAVRNLMLDPRNVENCSLLVVADLACRKHRSVPSTSQAVEQIRSLALLANPSFAKFQT